MYTMLLDRFSADRTQTGHILGAAAQRGREALPERQLSAVECAFLRFLTHAALYLAANNPAQVTEINCAWFFFPFCLLGVLLRDSYAVLYLLWIHR